MPLHDIKYRLFVFCDRTSQFLITDAKNQLAKGRAHAVIGQVRRDIKRFRGAVTSAGAALP
ncbi:MAG TPA: hypothetical protein EYG28_06845 [Nitrospiria bacterium]|nr:hypothetical protein [Candidatus Manganitrophaceae bacterium]HIL35089.1 hypothetical protein [Candidatus Manganitrophaceae bacterium]